MGVPAIFKLVVHAFVTAIFTSYKEPLGAEEWGRRYTNLVSQSPIDPIPLFLPKHPAARGVYAHNNILQNLTKLGDGLLLFPEDLALDPTETFLYVTNEDGWIKKYYFADAKVENWTYVGGRPLGIALDNAHNVLVCEPIQGHLIQISKDTGAKTILTTEAEGVKFGLIDEVIVASDGLIYFTDATSKYPLATWWYDVLEARPHGRVMVYNPVTKSTKVLIKDLQFANGITLSKSEEHLIFCETTRARVNKHYLKGPKKGKTETFIDNLPGHPDNIHRNKAGDRFYFAMLGNRNALTDFVFQTPILKHLLAWDNKLWGLFSNMPYIARFLEVDEHGKPLRFYEDSTGKITGMITTAVPSDDGYIYIGGLRDNFVGRVKLL
ncbi:hypothetical protein M758_10G036200 [Ceratodon purpureus]|nr:hypothetical protein M758_10G036200 [Ceratodon purpureus]KAG0602722.1 hypothetical protein M758_10G036200 [Ceratodon purpureus]